MVTLGSKEGLANLASAISSPGDVILVPNPSYPIHQFGFIIAGAAVRNIPVCADGDFLSALERAVQHSVPKPTAIVLNYPNNPTAELATLDFYGQVVDFCRHAGIYVMSDVAYAEIYFDGNPPPSILQVPGAKEICVEFTSMSKTYSMPGWRIGFACGNARLIAALARVKSYLDYGAFTPVQVAATAALNGPQECVPQMRERYKQRRDVLIAGLAAAGWEVPSPAATMFAWAPVPPAFKHLGSLEFSKLLLREAKVAVAPGHRLRRTRRRLCSICDGREPPSNTPGDPQHQDVPGPLPQCRRARGKARLRRRVGRQRAWGRVLPPSR